MRTREVLERPSVEDQRKVHLEHLDKAREMVMACTSRSSLFINFLPEVSSIGEEVTAVAQTAMMAGTDRDVACVAATFIRVLSESAGEGGDNDNKEGLENIAQLLEALFAFDTLDKSKVN